MANPLHIDKNILELAEKFGLNKEEATSFFEKLGRTPSKEELAVCGALWSEHCSYKSSRVHLKRFHTEEPWVLQGPGENAGVVAITKDYGIAFKMESHNHPSYIEPYQGAATGVGGILRDVFCMGAMPIANLNCLRFGEGSWNSHLLRDTVRGIGDYGNSIGVPTVGGDTSFHPGYSKNILVNAFCAGIIHKDQIYKGILSSPEALPSTNSSKVPIEIGLNINEKKEVYSALYPEGENILIYFGSATGRDGVHGATMSSSEFSSTAVTLKPTVQVGDPFAEKILLEATLSLIEKKLTIGLQDMGAAGLTSSSVEMAGRSGCGVVIDLNKVPQRASNMQAWEILLSESQERMLCAVEPHRVEEVITELEKFNLSTAVIGKVNRTGLFTCVFDDKIVTATPVPILIDDTPKYNWPIQSREDYLKNHAEIINTNKEPAWHGDISVNKKLSLSLDGKNEAVHQEILKEMSLENLVERFPALFSNLFSHPAFAAKDPLFHHYCSTVQGNTVTGCGTMQSSSAAVVRLPLFAQEKLEHKSHTNIGLAVAGGCEERWVELDPLTGAALTALKIARKIIAANGTPLAMTDCLNFGSPRAPEVMRQFSDAVDGINLVAKEMHIPIVSGNVSLNNQTEGKPIPPTPMIGMVGRVDEVTNIPFNILPKNYFQTHKEIHLIHIHCENAVENSSYEASQIGWILGGKNSHCPQLNLQNEKQLWHTVQNIIHHFKPTLCFPVGHGGLLGSIVTCALNSNAQLDLEHSTWQTPAKNLFAEGNMGFVFGISTHADIEKIMQVISQEKNALENKQATVVGVLKSNTAQVTKPLFDLEKVRELFYQALQRFY